MFRGVVKGIGGEERGNGMQSEEGLRALGVFSKIACMRGEHREKGQRGGEKGYVRSVGRVERGLLKGPVRGRWVTKKGLKGRTWKKKNCS